MPDICINLIDISKLLSNLQPNKADGPDEIQPIVLKELQSEISSIIQLIFERLLATGEVPSDSNKANVSPIFKKGVKSDPANYRPISLTCILCKVMEHTIVSKPYQTPQEAQLTYDLQHGFRQKSSCEAQLIQLAEDLGRQLEQGKQTDQVLLDFSRTFDKITY